MAGQPFSNRKCEFGGHSKTFFLKLDGCCHSSRQSLVSMHLARRHIRHPYGEIAAYMRLTLDMAAVRALDCRVPCSHAQRRTESGTDVSLLPQPCHSCSTFAIGAATLLAVLPARQLRSIAKAVLTLYDHLDLWHQNCMHSGGGGCGE